MAVSGAQARCDTATHNAWWRTAHGGCTARRVVVGRCGVVRGCAGRSGWARRGLARAGQAPWAGFAAHLLARLACSARLERPLGGGVQPISTKEHEPAVDLAAGLPQRLHRPNGRARTELRCVAHSRMLKQRTEARHREHVASVELEHRSALAPQPKECDLARHRARATSGHSASAAVSAAPPPHEPPVRGAGSRGRQQSTRTFSLLRANCRGRESSETVA
jgi:hypothetical protein